MNPFDVDFDKLVQETVPVQLRADPMPAWLEAKSRAFRRAYQTFKTARTNDLYDVDHTGQVCRLEAVLNDAFDTQLRRIRIVDGPDKEPLYLFLRNEAKPATVYRRSENRPVFLYRRAETAANGPLFIIQVPSGLQFDEVRMRALTDSYRLASINHYAIQIV